MALGVPPQLQQLLQRPANSRCADCDARKPLWASVNLGIFVCECCAGIHRNLGTHISQVRSVKLDTWRPEWIAAVALVGNERANAFYEHKVPEGERFRGSASLAGGDRLDLAQARQLERWVRAKYEERRFAPPGKPSPGELLRAGQVEAAEAPGGAGGPASRHRRHSHSHHHHGAGGPAPPPPWPSSDVPEWPSGPSLVAPPWPDVPPAATPGHSREAALGAWAAAGAAAEAAGAAPWPSAAPWGEEEVAKWSVEDRRLQQYQAAFEWADKDRDGRLSGEDARDILESSGLPSPELHRVWALADVDEDGFLSLGEFVCAMHLTYRRWEGHALPPALPTALLAVAQRSRAQGPVCCYA